MTSPCQAHETDNAPLSPSRRGFLAAALTGAAITLAPMSFAAADTGTSKTKTLTGHFDPGAADFVYLPVEVPAGVNKISVSYTYSKPTVASGLLNNACDIGVFDEKGTDLAGKGFRGWSGDSATSSSSPRPRPPPATCPARSGREPGTSHWGRTRSPNRGWVTPSMSHSNTGRAWTS
ncbi:hypothetical protein [Arthrobacter sp. SO3]|uniref:hypothetical protein n=1 Tax=Arthrobacter sp. SO3 TaxID=1897057 RepID=UPI001CFFF84B|nr:hypothetical protein [Arthrobacter sp. SO3]MCB5293397.1 hypothetical protein [Arthrobacter sp. SO3]